MDELDDYGNFFRKSVNDITSMLDINFGSLDRPRRGGRGRGTPGTPGSRPERARPLQDKVGHQEEQPPPSSELWCHVSSSPPGGAFGSKSWQPGGIPSTADWKITRISSFFMGMLVALGIWHKLKFLPFLRFGVLLYSIYFLKHKRHCSTLENKNYCKLTSWLYLESKAFSGK